MRKHCSRIFFLVLLIFTFAFFNFFQYDGGLSGIFADLTQSDFQVWSVPSTVKVKRNEINYSSKGPVQINISAVKNEYENSQLFITAYKEINNYYLSAADLHDGKGNTISSSNITVYNQKYINCSHENSSYGYSNGLYPDALIPMDYAAEAGETYIPQNNNAGLWITFYIPSDTVPGVYTANFTLTVESFIISVPVTVTVHDYLLTDKINYKTSFNNRIMQIAAGELDNTYEMMRAYYEFTLDYRISPKVLPKRSDTVDELVAAALEYFDRTACYDIFGTGPVRKLAENSTPEKNLLAKAYILDGFDEPYMYYLDNPNNPLLQNYGNILKSIKNELNAIANEIRNDTSGKYAAFKQIENWESYVVNLPIVIPDHFKEIHKDLNNPLVIDYLSNITIICPIWDTYNNQYRANYLSVVEQFDLDPWWYSTLAPQAPYATYHIADTNLLSARAISWLQKKYDIEGTIYWDIAGYVMEDYDNFGETKYKPINVYEYPYRLVNATFMPAGDGNLTYPGKAYNHYGPLPSMRLMSIRDGLEEYEMLADLENKYNKMAESGKYGEIDAESLMESFYSSLYYDGVKINRDGQSGLNFAELRSKLLRTLENINDPLSAMARTYNPLMNLKLSVNYQGGNITAQVDGDVNNAYQYQYWVKTKVKTDNNTANEVSNQYIWQIVRSYGSANSCQIPADEIYRDANGSYNILARIKEGNKVIEELYGVYSPEALGQPLISQVKIDGKAVSKDLTNDLIVIYKGQPVTIETFANMAGVTCGIYVDNDITPLYSGSSVAADFEELAAGPHILKVRAGEGQDADERTFRIYVVDEYLASEMPVITSLQGVSSSGNTTFTMKVKYADGSSISPADKDNFVYSLTSGGKEAAFIGAQANGGYIETVFGINYGVNGYGIYRTIGTVTRKDKSGDDDKIIINYSGYKRQASLSIYGDDEITAGNPAEITASGTIANPIGTIEYAFYREDASGWVLIRGYSPQGSFNWTPVRPGKYIIQARIKDSGAGSYECEVSREFNVTGGTLQGSLDLKVYDYNSGKPAPVLYAGRAYKLYAEYGGIEDVLFMFTQYTDNLKLIYLNNFNPNPYCIFIPETPGEHTITARALNCSNFGYKDKSVSVTFNVQIKPETEGDISRLDFEKEHHINYIRTVSDGNAVTYQRVSYSEAGIYAPSGNGDYALKMTPTVNPWPEFHILLDRKMYAMITFDYYVESSLPGGYAWNYKDSRTGESKGEIDSFTRDNHGTWYRATHTFDFESDEIWLWMYVSHSDVTEVNIYIDNINIIDISSVKAPYRLDAESEYHMLFIGTPDNDNAVTINRAAYDDLSITPPPTGGGAYVFRFTPTLNPWPEIHFKLNYQYAANTTIAFDYYVETNQAGFYGWNYKDPRTGGGGGEIDYFESSSHNAWYRASHTFAFESDEIWLWMWMSEGYSDVTQVNIYIDNFVIIEYPETIDFERDYHISYISTPKDNNAVTISLLSYQQAGIVPAPDGGNFVVRFTPTVNPWPEIHIFLPQTCPAGTRIEFDYYIESALPGDYAWNYKNPATGQSMGEIQNFTRGLHGAWYGASHTFNFAADQIWLWLAVTHSDVTQVNIYIDNIRIIY